MRKILVVLMLVCAVGLFAQIPAGTKSVAILTGGTSDILDSLGFDYNIDINAGYFIMDGLEIDAILGLMGSTYEGSEMNFDLGLGVLYHFPISPMLGLYGGAAFVYETIADGIMSIPIDVGLELFITQNNAIRLANSFTFYLTEGMDNTDEIILGTVHYFQ
jgi:hypothetical protein